MLRARANGDTFVPATMCLQQCVLVCQGLYQVKKVIVSNRVALGRNRAIHEHHYYITHGNVF